MKVAYTNINGFDIPEWKNIIHLADFDPDIMEITKLCMGTLLTNLG